MKRYILFLLVAMLECGIMFSQNNRPLSPMLNISGEFKRDYKDVKKGTACILQRVIKLKKPIGQEESTLQAVVVVGGVQVGIPMEELDVLKLIPADKTSFWQTAQLSNDLISYYEKKGYQGGMRQEQAREADDYMKELEHAKLFYDDAAIEDYLQCMLLSIIPEKMAVLREGTPLVRVLKSPAPDMLMLGNDCLLVSTGMLTALDSEEELYAVMSREVAHYVLDHAIITVNKNIARAKRAKMTSFPLSFSTRCISRSPLSRSSKLRTPNATVIASKRLSGKVSAVQSSLAKEMRLSSPAAFTFSRPTFIMPSDISVPISSWG